MGLVACKSQRDLNDSDNDSVYGRRPERNTFQSRYSYVHWKICKEYLKCEILPWKKLRSLGHPITLESLPTQFLDENHLRKCYFFIGKDKYLRVVGFRELLMKREYAEYLRDLDTSMTGAFKQHVKRPGVLALPSAYFKLARGGAGGYNAPHPGTGKKPPAVPQHPSQPQGKLAAPHVSNPQGKLAAHFEPPRVPPNLRRTSDDNGVLGKLATLIKGILSNHTPTKKELKRQELMHRSDRDKGQKAKDPEKILRQQMAKKWKWPHRRKRLPRPKSSNLVVLLHRLYRLPKENQERDKEWYYLSDTMDPDENVVQSFDKGLHTWMTQGISFESQKLVHQMRLFLSCLTLTGRSFLHLRKNFARGHIEFSSKKHNILPFAITSLVLWSILCLFFCSFMDINAVGAGVPNNFVKLEIIEVRKYWLPFLLTLGNLILVAFWSLTILLGDGAMIAHHLNCWCAALHEMETSAALDIRKLTLKNLQLYIIHAASFSLMFVFNTPTMIRGYCGLTAMLLLRPGVPFLRVSQPAKLLFYQWIGFGVHLYIMFSARMVMTLLQIFALMLRNVCEMWNFKFALTFKMLAEQNRGQLYQFQLNHSLAKLWNHHRLITLLLEHYGLVFCTAIMSYIIPQGLIFAIALAKLPFYDGSGLREFYGNETEVLVYSDAEPTITITYYNKTYEHLFLAILVLLQTGIDFIFTSETLISAQNAYMTGAEFVRRAGIMTSPKSHERKLLFSLQWSFSPTRLHALTANRYFVMDRASLLKVVSTFVLIFTILLRMQTPENLFKLEFLPRGSCNAALGQTLVRGICTVKIEPVTPRPPLPPPNFYYFFMDDCPRIKSKSMSHYNSSFEYFSVGTHSASKPPFQICKVGVNNGTSLSQDLRNIGRFFEDYGNRRLKQTLELYVEQTFDPNSKNFTSVTAPSADLYPDTTDGGYCGPDVSGQPKERCEWVEYYRDCVVACFSRRLKTKLLIPVLFKKDPVSNVFSLYSDYNEVDCGINPFGFKWFSTDPKDAAYDCFGNKMTEADYDQCGNLPFIEPAPPFTPAIGHHFQLYRGYSSNWEKPEKTFAAVQKSQKSKKCPVTCYNSDIGRIRCSRVGVVEKFCALSKYSGVTFSGYFYTQQCFELAVQVKATGFCKHEVAAGAIEVGHAIAKDAYESAKTNHWQASFNLAKGHLPCHNYESLREIEKNLYFHHTCIDPSFNATRSCTINTASAYFTALRPYHLECDSNLKQIPFNYEKFDGNKAICDFSNKVMVVPPANDTKFIVNGKEEKFTLFYGCRGKPLLPPQMGFTCLSPVVAGVCEADFGIFRLLSSDCTNEAINATGFITTRMTQFGFCNGNIDLSHNLFKNFSRKLVYESLYDDLLKFWKDPWTTPMSIRNAPGSTSCNENLNERYCGSNSVALHYPFDGYDSSGDKFLCNWEAYLRDCLAPYQSPFFRTEITTVYLPSWVEKKTSKLHPFHRKLDALLNTFVVGPGSDANDYATCEGRSYPGLDFVNSGVDPYWVDDCGWVITPEFVDGDPKGIAIMAPILPISRENVFGAKGDFVDKVLHCYQSEYALARCTHPDVFPICKMRLSVWEPSLEQVDVCYKFGNDCFTYFNKQPSGAKNDSLEYYPDGFCKGYCPFADTALEGSVSQSTMDVWKTAESLEFDSAPCNNSTTPSSDKTTQQIFKDPSAPRQIELQLFFQVHCSDPSQNQAIRDPRGPISGTFHWPLYRSSSGKLKLIPRESLVQHLVSTFGPGCDYKTQENEGKIYPNSVEVEPNVTISRDDFLGCHGHPLYWLTGEFNSNPGGLNAIGITDPYRDYKKACFGDLLGGWCEADVQHYYFLKEDFELTCKSKDCPSACTKNQGLYAATPLAKVVAEDVNYPFFVKTIYQAWASTHVFKS